MFDSLKLLKLLSISGCDAIPTTTLKSPKITCLLSVPFPPKSWDISTKNHQWSWNRTTIRNQKWSNAPVGYSLPTVGCSLHFQPQKINLIMICPRVRRIVWPLHMLSRQGFREMGGEAGLRMTGVAGFSFNHVRISVGWCLIYFFCWTKMIKTCMLLLYVSQSKSLSFKKVRYGIVPSVGQWYICGDFSEFTPHQTGHFFMDIFGGTLDASL